MVKDFTILIYCLFLTGCELIVLNSTKPIEKKIEINQKTPVGTIYLFKMELDSDNIPAATNMITQSKGIFYTAIERYEMWDEVSRLSRLISDLPITNTTIDSLSNKSYKVNIELNYYRTISFLTEKINNQWYITQYSESKYYNWSKK
jgi:hypothetical protein